MVEFWVIAGVVLLMIASLAGMAEVDERRKNYEAGTHDYYGNKL